VDSTRATTKSLVSQADPIGAPGPPARFGDFSSIGLLLLFSRPKFDTRLFLYSKKLADFEIIQCIRLAWSQWPGLVATFGIMIP